MVGTAAPGSPPASRSRSDRFALPDGATVMVRPTSRSADAPASTGDAPGARSADPDSTTAAAVVRARGQLGQLRLRFLQGELPPLGHVIVRHRLAIPGGSEAPWVLARSWRTRARLEGRCLNDAVHPSLAHIRMGRAVVVDVDQVVDWAIVDACGSVIDGGWSRDLRWAPPAPEQPPPAPRPPLPTGAPPRTRLTTGAPAPNPPGRQAVTRRTAGHGPVAAPTLSEPQPVMRPSLSVVDTSTD
ncbi:hypothetical protein [Pseudofrankia inefficax]|uniref:DUF2314 domain-containing protein n=1 Tax=Pseudofrankia inefficax (strain DSM 45817 / CECT 9037 / DDB 130130 / EuI1c) TaxID=298654 RepID=E3JDN4_PSEI1|nr:hypothetical protein [Pseudofrankia inefficax]ADP84800.1 hypothetical protein FraEuI1c_6831 [Pseudofrankia inefficax]